MAPDPTVYLNKPTTNNCVTVEDGDAHLLISFTISQLINYIWMET